jgi:hypothetical protein
MDDRIPWISQKSIEILFIMMTALTMTICGTANLSFAKSKADSPKSPIIPLQHIPTGKADLQWNSATHTLVVTITVVGLAPNSTHPATIQQGDSSFAHCNQPIQGKTMYNLNPLKSDKFGKVNSVTTTIANVPTGIPDSGWYLAVLNNSQLTTNPQQIRIACGEIVPGGIPHPIAPDPNNVLPASPSPINTPTTKDQSVHVSLMGSADANQLVVGNAAVSLNNDTLTVIFSLGNLVPNSKHAASIHKGTCESQGPIIFPLNDVNVDEHGQGSSTTTIKSVSSLIKSVSAPSISSFPWYINVYETSSNNGSDSQTGIYSIACGNFSSVVTLPSSPELSSLPSHTL